MEKKTSPTATNNSAPRTTATPGADLDDLVHAGEDQLPSVQPGADPDDTIHNAKPPVAGDDSFEDPDDRVHARDNEDKDER